MRRQTDELTGNMEFLFRQLQREWDRSGAVTSSVFIPLEKTGEINRKLAHRIMAVRGELEEEKLTFQKSIRKVKQCHVLLRLVRKIKKQADKSGRKPVSFGFSIELDREEWKLFQEIWKEEMAEQP
jgi:hypothetical protein